MKVLYLDESGDHNLSIIDPQYPLFVLGGVIVDLEYAEGELAERMREFKLRVFGRDDIILHTADITRNRNGFERMQEDGFRERFYKDLNALMAGLEYQAVACVVKKQDHLARYGVAALDPYLLSLDILVERFCLDVRTATEGGTIVAERRDPTLDRLLELAWQNLKVQGTRFVRSHVIRERISGLSLRAKSADVAGLQLADLVVTPIGRAVLGKPVRDDYEIVHRKLRRGPKGEADGFGLVILPK